MNTSSEAVATSTSSTIFALIPIGIALNLALGSIVSMLKLPIFLDAVGTIIVTLLAGFRAGAIAGVGSFVLLGVFVNPAYPWFAGTQVAIAGVVHLAARAGAYRTWPSRILAGVVLGLVAGTVSAPVIVYLFGGISGSGASLISAYLLATGRRVIEAVMLSGLAAEPLDKTLQTLLAYSLLRGTPADLLARFNRPVLERNRLL